MKNGDKKTAINNGDKCKQVAELQGGKWDKINDCCKRVYGVDAISPTIHTCAGGNTEPKILEIVKINEKRHSSAQNSVLDTNGISPAIDTMQGGNRQPKILVSEAAKKGYTEAEIGDSINLEQPNSTTRRGRVGKGIAQTITTQTQQAVVEPFIVASRGRNPDNPNSRQAGLKTEQKLEPKYDGTTNTITTVKKDNYVVESKPNYGRMGAQAIETYNKNDVECGYTINQFNQSVDDSGSSPTITTRPEGFKTAILPIDHTLIIRKLTPKECYRLMGFTDKQYVRASKVVSNSQLYKEAGNSIVVLVLVAIFGMMISGKEDLYKLVAENLVEYLEG